MPVTKRTTKVVSYNEQDDDDDFIPIVDNNNKKNRKIITKQSLQKHDEKLSKSEQEKPELVFKHSEGATIENPITIDDKENTNNQSIVSNDDSKTSSEKLIDIDDQDENLSPKTKRIRYEEEDDTNESEDEPMLKKQSISKTEETIKKIEMSSIDLNTSRTDQQNSSIRTTDLPKKRSSAPLGFPTSKINIPSPHISRVGLSRKSSSIKPLHPNFTSRIVHD